MANTPAFLGPALSQYRPGDLSMTYTDYLQKREFDDHLALRITEPIKALITSTGQGFGLQIDQLKAMEASSADASYQIVCSVDGLRQATAEGFSQLGSVLDWGFSELIFQESRSNELLSNILSTLKSPSLTWAYEQFERARDRYRRGHYAKALDALQKAIEGHAGELGEDTEYRFYFLRGIIRLGSLSNHDPEVVNLGEAEQSFLLAAQYAAYDFPDESADSYMCAARAANLQGRHREAAQYCNRGLKLCETSGLHYEAARALIEIERDADAKAHLQTAIRLDKMGLLKACGDPGFAARGEWLRQVLQELADEARTIAQTALDWLDSEIRAASSVTYTAQSTGESFVGDPSAHAFFGDVAETRERLAHAIAGGGILDLREALESVPKAFAALESWNSCFANGVSAALGQSIRESAAAMEQSTEQAQDSAQSNERIASSLPLLAGGGFFLLGLISSLSQCQAGNIGAGLGSLFGGVIGAFVFGAIAMAISAFVVSASNSSTSGSIGEAKQRHANFKDAVEREQYRLTQATHYRPDAEIQKTIPSWAATFGT